MASSSGPTGPSRVLAIWCMDWPAVAAAAAADQSATAPVAVTLANRVIACSASARAAGVRRGRRRRQAQARGPELHVGPPHAPRGAPPFQDVEAAADELGAPAEVLRPPPVVRPGRGAGR